MDNSEKLALGWDDRIAVGLRSRRTRAERRAAPVWLWPNLLSLDAPLVAVAWEILIMHSTGAPAASATTLILGLAVWLIYVADRLLDALRGAPGEDLAARHRFYRAHWRAFLAPLAAGLTAGAWLAWTHLDAATFRHGLWLLGVVAGYFALVHLAAARRWFPKELAVAVLFAAGCFLPAWQGDGPPSFALILPWILFAWVCWMNISTIEHTEWERLRLGGGDPPHRWSAALARHPVVASGVALLALLLIKIAAPGGARLVMSAAALSALALAALSARRDRLSADAVRVLADAALLAPLALLPFLR